MLSEDYSISKTKWKRYEEIHFKSSAELLTWISDDKRTFHLSNKVYEAVIDCLENDIDLMIVLTLVVDTDPKSEIDVQIRKENFQKILGSYTKKLMENEEYEILAKVSPQMKKYGFEIWE